MFTSSLSLFDAAARHVAYLSLTNTDKSCEKLCFGFILGSLNMEVALEPI